MVLTYINLIGKDYNDNYLYDFIFSTNVNNIDGLEWENSPASKRPKPPYSKFISGVGRVETTISFDLIQNSDTFSMWDSVDLVIALGWENISGYEDYPKNRLVFNFGETLDDVSSKLKRNDITMIFNNKKDE